MSYSHKKLRCTWVKWTIPMRKRRRWSHFWVWCFVQLAGVPELLFSLGSSVLRCSLQGDILRKEEHGYFNQVPALWIVPLKSYNNCCKFQLYFKIITESHVVRHSTKKSCVLSPVPPVVTSCITVVACHNWEIVIPAIGWRFSDFLGFTCARECMCVCVCVCVYIFI